MVERSSQANIRNWSLVQLRNGVRLGAHPITLSPFLIGRGDAEVNVALPDPLVSSIHAEILSTEEGLVIID